MNLEAMKFVLLANCFSILSVSAAVLSERTSIDPDDNTHNTPIRNANHIFNAIRGAIRQWDNSWNHNGMSFFVATVPEGVQLYHGTSQSEPIVGMEWLAFEPEHALMFARPRGRGPPDGRGPGYHPGPPSKAEHGKKYNRVDHGPPAPGGPGRSKPPPSPPPPRHGWDEHRGLSDKHDQQQFLGGEPPEHPPRETQPNSPGYLHFYRSSHDLKLVYIDGLSAGKTTKGTLDSQDYILGLNKYNATNSPMRERERAKALCNLAHTTWSGRIDGFIRMESGFEIILCDFKKGLTFGRAQEVPVEGRDKPHGPGLNSFRLYQAVADRFDGIGGGRAVVDHASLISAFDFDFEIDLFVEDKTMPGQMLPRLDGQKEEDLKRLQEKVINTIAEAVRARNEPTIDWQSIADMFVQRYAKPLRHLAEPTRGGKAIERELQSLLQPFISDGSNDTLLVTNRCVDQFLPPVWPATFAGRVVQQVASELCGTLIKTLHDLETADHKKATDHNASDSAKQAIAKLAAYLDWPIWRECSPACNFDEVCVLPIWPITGSIADRRLPTCRNATTFNEGFTGPRGGNDSYWWNGEEMHPPPFPHLPL